MRYIVFLLVLTLLLSACTAVQGGETTAPTQNPTEHTTAPTQMTEPPTQPPTEEATQPTETEPTLTPEESAKEIAKEYLNSRFACLTGEGDEEILHADDALTEEIQTLRQTLIDDGIVLTEGNFFFSGMEQTPELTVVYMIKSLGGKHREEGFFREYIYRLELVEDGEGGWLVIADTPASADLLHEDGEAYMLQCLQEHLQSRKEYLTQDGTAEILHASEKRKEHIEEERQTMVEEGRVLVDVQYEFGEVFYERTHGWVKVWQTEVYLKDGQETTEKTECKFFITEAYHGDFVVASAGLPE